MKRQFYKPPKKSRGPRGDAYPFDPTLGTPQQDSIGKLPYTAPVGTASAAPLKTTSAPVATTPAPSTYVAPTPATVAAAPTFNFNAQQEAANAANTANSEFDLELAGRQQAAKDQQAMIANQRDRSLASMQPMLGQATGTIKSEAADQGSLFSSLYGRLINEAGNSFNQKLADTAAGFNDQIAGVQNGLSQFAGSRGAWTRARVDDLVSKAREFALGKFGADSSLYLGQEGVNVNREQLAENSRQFDQRLGLDTTIADSQRNLINAQITDIARTANRSDLQIKADIMQAVTATGLSIKEIMNKLPKGFTWPNLNALIAEIKNELSAPKGDPMEQWDSRFLAPRPMHGSRGDAYSDSMNAALSGDTLDWSKFKQQKIVDAENAALQRERLALDKQAQDLAVKQFDYTSTHDANGNPISSDPFARWSNLVTANAVDSDPNTPGMQRAMFPRDLIANGLANGVDVIGMAQGGDQRAIAALRSMYPALSSNYPDQLDFVSQVAVRFGKATSLHRSGGGPSVTPASGVGSMVDAPIPTWAENYARWMGGDNTAPGNKASWFDEFGYHSNPIAGIGSGLQTLSQKFFTPRIVR
jgi:hypothetical protein